jgi:hypothetical protein
MSATISREDTLGLLNAALHVLNSLSTNNLRELRTGDKHTLSFQSFIYRGALRELADAAAKLVGDEVVERATRERVSYK